MKINGLTTVLAVSLIYLSLSCSSSIALVGVTATGLSFRKEGQNAYLIPGSLNDEKTHINTLQTSLTRTLTNGSMEERQENGKNSTSEDGKASVRALHETGGKQTRKRHTDNTQKRKRNRKHKLVHKHRGVKRMHDDYRNYHKDKNRRKENYVGDQRSREKTRTPKKQKANDEKTDSDEATVKHMNDKTDKLKHEKNLLRDEAEYLSEKSKLSKKTLKNLREALNVHPFRTWKFKGRFNSMNDLGIHEAQLHDNIDNKWNKRLEHKLYKVFDGKNIHMAIIGGSNTAGGGIQEDEGGTDGIFFRVISDWWRKSITPITGSHLKVRQIAMGGTASDFFQFCYANYIQDNVDLVLLEMSVNDLKELPPNVNLSLPIEQLTRQLLEFPTNPALIYINLLSGRSYYQGCMNLEDFGQKLLSDIYKITTFSWRDAVCPKTYGQFRAPLKTCGVVCKDGHHINQLGHAHVSLMIINLLRDLLLHGISQFNKGTREIFNDNIILPRPVFIHKPSKIVTTPICWTTVTPNFMKAKIQNSMDVGVMENYGFDYLHNKPIGGTCMSAHSCRADAYSGWTGKDVGASLTLSFTVPALGHKRRIKSRSVVFATRTCSKCGGAQIWLDDDYSNRRFVLAKSNYYQTSMEIIALRVNPGDHTMSIRVVVPGEVTVVGVMLGPPDGPY